MWCFLSAAISDAPQVAGLSPQELTQLNMDKTRLLEKLIADEYGGNADIMLGELQVILSALKSSTSLCFWSQSFPCQCLKALFQTPVYYALLP